MFSYSFVSAFNEVYGVIVHFELEREYAFEVGVMVHLGVNALSNRGEFVHKVAEEEAEIVIGVRGRSEKLFEDDFAGVIVVEWVRLQGKRVMLNGNDCKNWDVTREGI